MLDLEWGCDVCGEVNEAVIDPAEGEGQDFVSDCAVCCRPHRLVLVRWGAQEWGLRVEAC